jgi:hypothetical protein
MEALVMALEFKTLKSPLLELHDKITVGKLAGCRVADVLIDHYEYLIWADKSGLLKFSKTVRVNLAEIAGYVDKQIHFENEVEPWLVDYDEIVNKKLGALRREVSFLHEDIPF